MLRFAYSSADDIDIDTLRIALFNYIVSKQNNEDFIVIHKDTNTDILDILSLFGIKYSQVIDQNKNLRFYSAMALQLVQEKKSFSCFCSSKWIEKKKQEAKDAKIPYRYDDACANLPAELVIDNTNPFTIRIKKAKNTITVNDSVFGKLDFDPNESESFVIMNQNKTPTYEFASAVDDMLNDISFIIRSEKDINMTPNQIHIRNSLGYSKEIKYAHLPEITLKNNERISIKRLIEDGFLPEAILNYLISITIDTFPEDIFSLDDTLKHFKLESISNSPALFDMKKLKETNRRYLYTLDSKELSRYVGFADEEIGELAKFYLKEVYTTKELKAKIQAVFTTKNIENRYKDQADILTKTIKEAPYFDKYKDFEKYTMEKSGLDGEDFFKPLSILLTNKEDNTDIEIIYNYLKNYIKEIIK